MDLPCRWRIVLIGLWIQVGFVPGTHCKTGTVDDLSRKDILPLKDEPNPKCFTRTDEDFTCFFETADNGTYDLFYTYDRKKSECEMSVQRTEEGIFLHICSFPHSDVILFYEYYLEVVEGNTNISIYQRNISVEDHVLLDPPFNVSLHQNGQAGQLQVSWTSEVPKYRANYITYRIQYSHKGLKKTKEEEGSILDSLVPGEEVEVQVSGRFALRPNTGHWSSWSQPARAVVPQSADDIVLLCYTSDLQNITCQWNGSIYAEENDYKLFYKMGLRYHNPYSAASSWTEWTECLPDRDLTDMCRFHGDESREVKVKLCSTPPPLSRTFYSKQFTLNKSVKTFPPHHLRAVLKNDKLCLKWEAPLPSLSAHLQYEVRYKIRGEDRWKFVFHRGPETDTCLEVPAGSQYSVQLRATPIGLIYSGNCSDWSHVLTGDTPSDTSKLLMLCVPVVMLITAVIVISLYPMYLSKLKLYFWPPVPKPALQGFLTEINGHKWNPPLTAKPCFEETTSSVVEVMSEDEVSGLGKPSEESTQLLTPEGSFSSSEEVDGSPGAEFFPDYVTLNKGSIILCPKGNGYVEEQVGEKDGVAVKDEVFQTRYCSCTDGSISTPPCSDTDFLNHSYFPLAEPADRLDCKLTAVRGPGNLYTNLPRS